MKEPCILATLLAVLTPAVIHGEDFGTSGYASSDGVKIHYRTAGKGPLLVLIHGFPDFWYTWRHQLPLLEKHFQVVAIDLRGYNLSDKPVGVEHYTMDRLVGDVVAVIKHFKKDRATIIGHDWGGAIAWTFAATRPDRIDRLVVLNCPHPVCLQRELVNNPDQQKASAYARNFQEKDAHTKIKPPMLTFWIKNAEDRKKYLAALERSSMEGMLNYYKANYPRAPYVLKNEQPFPRIKCPVLLIHGLDDTALLPGGLNGTWEHVAGELTLVTIPRAGHWVHHDAPELVNRRLLSWLTSK